MKENKNERRKRNLFEINRNALTYGDDNAKIYSRYSAEELSQWAEQCDNMFNKDVIIYYIRAARNFAELISLQ